MLQLGEEITHKILNDIDHLDLALAKIPTKVLYKLQMTTTNEVKSRARTDAKNLETTKDEKEVLEIALKGVQIERDE
jgi:hypothetical protein